MSILALLRTAGRVRCSRCCFHLSSKKYKTVSTILWMIAHLRGKLITRHPNLVVLETAGVGYQVTGSVPTFSQLPSLGSEVALHIHTHVREDQLALYGFIRPEEKELFEKLITVRGI